MLTEVLSYLSHATGLRALRKHYAIRSECVPVADDTRRLWAGCPVPVTNRPSTIGAATYPSPRCTAICQVE